MSIPQKGEKRLVGEVIGTYDVEPFGPRKIRDVGLLVRGRSGKKLRITAVANYVNFYSTWKEADAASKEGD
jgi:hypothetical protein